MVAGRVSISLWIQHEIKDAVIQRTGEVTALYVNSFVSPQLGVLDQGSRLPSAAVEALDGLLSETALGSDIVAFKLWAADGTVIYSPNRALIGRRFGIHPELERALAGGIVSKLSDLSLPDNVHERELWDLLIETYAPVRVEGSPDVVAVAEFYQDPEPLLTGIRRAQLLGWAFVGAATPGMYLLLVGHRYRPKPQHGCQAGRTRHFTLRRPNPQPGSEPSMTWVPSRPSQTSSWTTRCERLAAWSVSALETPSEKPAPPRSPRPPKRGPGGPSE